MPVARRSTLTELLFRAHPWIYRKSGGRILGRFGSSPVLLLNTRGRKSGQPRTNGLIYLDRGDSWAVAASWAGEPKHPIWYLNLMAQPDVEIQIRDQVIPVRARKLEGEERARVWAEIVEQDEGFAVYEDRTRGIREIPVVLFEKRTALT
jgi:deazaflavin-dependent oxidoreductase (nitroreductase family)